MKLIMSAVAVYLGSESHSFKDQSSGKEIPYYRFTIKDPASGEISTLSVSAECYNRCQSKMNDFSPYLFSFRFFESKDRGNKIAIVDVSKASTAK